MLLSHPSLAATLGCEVVQLLTLMACFAIGWAKIFFMILMYVATVPAFSNFAVGGRLIFTTGRAVLRFHCVNCSF